MLDQPKPCRLFKLGLLVNPYAGIGGALALKGSDGVEVREKALAMGAEKQALHKTRLALEHIVPIKDQVQLFVASGDMGESLAKDMGFSYSLVYQPENTQTESQDSEDTAQALLAQQVDLILFSGGDWSRNGYIDCPNPVPSAFCLEKDFFLGFPFGEHLPSWYLSLCRHDLFGHPWAWEAARQLQEPI